MTAAIAGTGTITSLTSTAVSIQHGAIESVGWGAKTTEFAPQDPAMLKGLKVGDQVIFQLKSADQPLLLIAILKT